MTLLHRRIVYITFVLIFLIAAPLIVLYTQGYRYNFQKGRVQKTGIIKITTIPNNAEIWLNGQLVAGQETPAKIEYVLPGDYEILLRKNGYHDWQKKLPVYENGTTFAEKVILWKAAQPQIISSGTAAGWLLSPDRKKIAYLPAGRLAILDFNDSLIENLLTANPEKIETVAYPENAQDVKIISWSADGKKILLDASVGDIKAYLTYNLDNKSFRQINDNGYRIIKWDQNNDNLLYGLNRAGLWQIDLAKNKITPSAKIAAAEDFMADGDTLYYLVNGALYTNHGALAGKIEINDCPACRISEQKSGHLMLFDGVNQKIKFIDLSGTSKSVSAAAKNYVWLNNDVLLFYNDWELYIFDLNKKEPELITRLGHPIDSAVWQPQGRHIVFVSENKIKMIELDDRELRNVIILAENVSADDLQINRSGKDIYFNGSHNGQAGIYKLNIQ